MFFILHHLSVPLIAFEQILPFSLLLVLKRLILMFEVFNTRNLIVPTLELHPLSDS